MLESSFIALMGILSGVVGGVIISRNLFTTGQFAGEGIDFTMPWTEILVFAVIAFVVSLLMTWWPSRERGARCPSRTPCGTSRPHPLTPSPKSERGNRGNSDPGGVFLRAPLLSCSRVSGDGFADCLHGVQE